MTRTSATDEVVGWRNSDDEAVAEIFCFARRSAVHALQTTLFTFYA
jgi:hypothetical protein